MVVIIPTNAFNASSLQASHAKRLAACEAFTPAHGIASQIAGFFCGGFAARVVGVARDLAVFGLGWNQTKARQTTRHTLALVALDHNWRWATRIRL